MPSAPGQPANLSNPCGSSTSSRIVADAAGRFQLRLDREGKTWVGVRAQQGHASSKVLTDVPPGGGYLVVRLEPGAAVTGKVLAPPGRLSRVLERQVGTRVGTGSDGREDSAPHRKSRIGSR